MGNQRKKRLDLNLSQPEAARMINVTTDTNTNWKLNRTEPYLNAKFILDKDDLNPNNLLSSYLTMHEV